MRSTGLKSGVIPRVSHEQRTWTYEGRGNARHGAPLRPARAKPVPGMRPARLCAIGAGAGKARAGHKPGTGMSACGQDKSWGLWGEVQHEVIR